MAGCSLITSSKTLTKIESLFVCMYVSKTAGCKANQGALLLPSRPVYSFPLAALKNDHKLRLKATQISYISGGN